MERDEYSQPSEKFLYATPRIFSRVELTSFISDPKNVVGFGGFGDVYVGKFSNGVETAIRVLKENTNEIVIKQFMGEVSTMGSVSHPNLIKLYGYCIDNDMKALVYEYIKNGSLDKILFKNHLDIEWGKLYNIAIEIANGLSYLHEVCHPRIIHYDIKPENVLIDSNLSPKIIDFGMARHSSQVEQSGYRGTSSYAAPEVGKGRLVTYKSDVYSFGMMLFEILRKKRNSVGPGWFPGEVGLKVENEELDEIFLVCGIEEKNRKNAEKLSLVALWCTQERHLNRPDMSIVVKMLKGEIVLEKPPNPFGFYDDTPQSSMFGARPLPKFTPAIIERMPEENSLERAKDSTHKEYGSSSTSQPTLKSISLDDESNSKKPLLMAVKEQVYNVTQGRSFSSLWGGFPKVSGLFASLPRPTFMEEDMKTLQAPVQLGELTEEELKAYDGSDSKKPLLVAIKGQIYDVTQNRMLYGPGGPYALYSGKDASRAIAKRSFEEEDLIGDITGLGPFELDFLQDWEDAFMSKYDKVGTIKKIVPVDDAPLSR